MATTNVKLKNKAGVYLYPQSAAAIIDYKDTEGGVKTALDELLTLMKSDYAMGGSVTDAFSDLDGGKNYYNNLYNLAKTVKGFLDGSAADGIIDTWQEIEKFLQGITDSDSLTAMLNEQYTKITNEYTAAIEALKDSTSSDLSALTARVAQNESDIASLTTRMGTAESNITTLQSNLTNEINTARTNENNIAADLSGEITRATGVETELRSDLSDLQEASVYWEEI